jgi:hypothetical protein
VSSTLQVGGSPLHFPISMLNAEQQQRPKNFTKCIYCSTRLDDPKGCIHAVYIKAHADKTDTARDVVACLRKGCERSLRAKAYHDTGNHEKLCRLPKGETHQKSDYEQYEWAGTTPRLHLYFICTSFGEIARLPALVAVLCSATLLLTLQKTRRSSLLRACRRRSCRAMQRLQV